MAMAPPCPLSKPPSGHWCHRQRQHRCHCHLQSPTVTSAASNAIAAITMIANAAIPSSHLRPARHLHTSAKNTRTSPPSPSHRAVHSAYSGSSNSSTSTASTMPSSLGGGAWTARICDHSTLTSKLLPALNFASGQHASHHGGEDAEARRVAGGEADHQRLRLVPMRNAALGLRDGVEGVRAVVGLAKARQVMKMQHLDATLRVGPLGLLAGYHAFHALTATTNATEKLA